jgi:hypothetical protein
MFFFGAAKKKNPLSGAIVYDPYRQIASGTTGQTLKNYGIGGAIYDAQLGSTAGEDTADPTWGANSLVFPDGTDYAGCNNAGISTPDAWTVFCVFAPNTLATLSVIFGWNPSLDIGTTINDGLATRVTLYMSSGCFRGFTSPFPAALNTPQCLMYSLPGNLQTSILGSEVYVNNVKCDVVSTTSTGPQNAKTQLMLARSKTAYGKGALYYYAQFPFVVAESQRNKCYAYIKKLMAQRGISI